MQFGRSLKGERNKGIPATPAGLRRPWLLRVAALLGFALRGQPARIDVAHGRGAAGRKAWEVRT